MTRRVLLSYISLALFVLILLEIPLAIFFADRERERFTNRSRNDQMNNARPIGRALLRVWVA